MGTDEIIKAKAELEASIMKQAEEFAVKAGTNFSLTLKLEVTQFFTGESPNPMQTSIEKRFLTSSIG